MDLMNDLCRASAHFSMQKEQGARSWDDGWQKWRSLMTEISGSHSLLTSLLTSNFRNVYHPLGMCSSRLLMAKSEMTELFILVSQRRPLERLALMIPMTQFGRRCRICIPLHDNYRFGYSQLIILQPWNTIMHSVRRNLISWTDRYVRLNTFTV